MTKEALPPGVLPHITDTDPPPTDPRTVVVPGVGMHIASDEEMAAMKREAEKAKAAEHKPAEHAEEHKPAVHTEHRAATHTEHHR